MKPFLREFQYRSSIHQYTFNSRIIGVTTIVALILFCTCSYELAGLSTIPPSNSAADSMQKGSPSPPLKAAVIIEGRTLPNLIPLILHFSSVLGPEWPIKVLHMAKNRNQFFRSPAFQRQTSSGHITLQQLPSNVSFTSRDAVSKFLTQPWLYHNLAPYEHILLFQSDSILCANSPRMVEDFLEYDFIGAPIDPKYGQGMNGGLSLRKRETMLRVIERNQFTGKPEDGSEFEDQWFFQKLEELPRGPNNATGARLPSVEVAAGFSVETMWRQQPFGLHQVSRWQLNHMEELDRWCPEHRLAGGVAF